ncbi:MAG: LysR substrate-binding domain-containing protein [Acidobacteriota bacterium]
MRLPDLGIDLLRTFVAVASAHGFTAAGELLGLTQSAVSQQVKRLEDLTGSRLLSRTSRTLAFTPEGEALLEYAHRMLELNDEAVRRLRRGQAGDTLRLGVTEDFIQGQLSALLRILAAKLPSVRLQVATGLSTGLLKRLGDGELDVVVAKREERKAQGGQVVWRERLAWIAGEDFLLPEDGPLPLVMLPAPCSYRTVMLKSLSTSGWTWEEGCTAGSIPAVQAAVEAGLGVSILGASFLGPGVRELSHKRLPALPQSEIAVFGAGLRDPGQAAILKDALLDVLGGAASAR